jgi:hypothetical protein
MNEAVERVEGVAREAENDIQEAHQRCEANLINDGATARNEIEQSVSDFLQTLSEQRKNALELIAKSASGTSEPGGERRRSPQAIRPAQPAPTPPPSPSAPAPAPTSTPAFVPPPDAPLSALRPSNLQEPTDSGSRHQTTAPAPPSTTQRRVPAAQPTPRTAGLRQYPQGGGPARRVPTQGTPGSQDPSQPSGEQKQAPQPDDSEKQQKQTPPPYSQFPDDLDF